MATHTTTGPCVCAWCLKEQNVRPREEDSHGICTKHREQLDREYDKIVAERTQKRVRR